MSRRHSDGFTWWRVNGLTWARGDVFLDDMTIAEVVAAAKAPVRIVEATAAGLLAGATESGGRAA